MMRCYVICDFTCTNGNRSRLARHWYTCNRRQFHLRNSISTTHRMSRRRNALDSTLRRHEHLECRVHEALEQRLSAARPGEFRVPELLRWLGLLMRSDDRSVQRLCTLGSAPDATNRITSVIHSQRWYQNPQDLFELDLWNRRNRLRSRSRFWGHVNRRRL